MTSLEAADLFLREAHVAVTPGSPSARRVKDTFGSRSPPSDDLLESRGVDRIGRLVA